MTNLLTAARVPKDKQVEVVKVQLTDVARTWWLAEEERLEPPIPWEQFMDSFYERFFPKTAQREMEQQFINLQHGSRSIDEYAAEFLRLSRFAPYIVAAEKDWANRFQQGLRLEIQKFLVTQPLRTYSQVLSSARSLEQVVEKENKNKVHARPLKRPFDQVTKGPTSRFGSAPHNKQQFTPSPRTVVCRFCQLPGHHRGEYRRANRLCLACGARDHQLVNCPSKGQRSVVPVAPASEAANWNSIPAGRGVPLPPQ